MQHASPAEADMLQTGYMRLVGEGKASATANSSVHGVKTGTQQADRQADSDTDVTDGMGLTYQAMAITSSDAPTPVAFET